MTDRPLIGYAKTDRLEDNIFCRIRKEKLGGNSITVVKKNIPISLPSLGDEEWQALKIPLSTGWITQGPLVKEFEELFAEKHNVKHALAVTSCTTALHISLAALGIGPDDEVIIPAFTWVATANAVLYCGAKPVFADIDLKTFNLDPESIQTKISPATKAIIPVHLFGLIAEMDEIRDAAPNIALVEDAACAIGASYKNNMAGGLGDLGCFSFHPRKVLTTGEGGMVTTNNNDLAERVNKLRNHGASISEEQRHIGPKPYILPDFDVMGFNYRMTDLQGAMGVVQINKLDAFISERRKWAEYYSENLSEIDWLQTPHVPNYSQHGWQSYVLLIDEKRSSISRNEMMEKLQSKGISTRPGTHAVHMLNFYAKKYGLKPEDFPNAFQANEFSMSIPLHNKMDDDDCEYIVASIKSLQ